MFKTSFVRTLFAAALLATPLAVAANPVYVLGNPTCAELDPFFVGIKIDQGAESAYDFSYTENGIIVTATGSSATLVDTWTSTIPIDAVIVKAATGAYVYYYDPEVMSGGGLITPNTQDNTGNPAALSHISFCYDYELDVNKTADTSFTRTHYYAWTIDKSAAETELLLSQGQTYRMDYALALQRTEQEALDSDWAVSGQISVVNNTPFPAKIMAISDNMGEMSIALACPDLPLVLRAGESLTCTYASALASGEEGLNMVSVETIAEDDNKVRGASATAEVIFGEPTTIAAVDDCVDVTDTFMAYAPEHMGNTCVDRMLGYSRLIGSYASEGTYEVPNSACFTTNSTETQGCDSENVSVTVAPMNVGCTLTQGYWRTHSKYGPAPYDDTWMVEGFEGIGGLEDALFFLSPQTHHQVLWTPPKGNAYYNLAHQWIAAFLNLENGAFMPDEVVGVFEAAQNLLNEKTPDDLLKLKGKDARELPALFIQLSTVLDNYNNGELGPGHCSEEAVGLNE
jgi:hypothetical protein